MTANAENHGKFALRMEERMKDLNFSIKDMAEKCDTTYEHIRKLVKGLAFPSKHMLKIVCDALGLNKIEMEALANEDRARAKGWVKSVMVAAGGDPRLESLNALASDLTDNDIAELLTIARMKQKYNREMSHNGDSKAAKKVSSRR